jgi:hypothetical protein
MYVLKLLGGSRSVDGWGYATIRKVVGSNPDEVIDFFQFTYSFQPRMALGFIHPRVPETGK